MSFWKEGSKNTEIKTAYLQKKRENEEIQEGKNPKFSRMNEQNG